MHQSRLRMLSLISTLETYLHNTLLNYLQLRKEKERNTMGGCFSLQNEHDTQERQNVATENVIQIPVDDQHQQPGSVPVTLCQSIYDFFKECLPCIGGSGDEEGILIPPSAEDEVLEIAHNP